MRRLCRPTTTVETRNHHVLVFHDVFSKWVELIPLRKATAPKYDGPYTVTRFISPNLVLLRRPGERRSRSANISQLKPYYSEDFGNAAAEEDDGTAPGGGTRG